MSVYSYDPESGLPHKQPAPDDDETVTALRETATAARYRLLDERNRESGGT